MATNGAPRIAQAQGILGTNRDYLYRTRHHLQRLGVNDEYIERLAAAVANE